MERTLTEARTWTQGAGAFATQLKNRFFWKEAPVMKDEVPGGSPGFSGPQADGRKAPQNPGPAMARETPAGPPVMYFRKGASMVAITCTELVTCDADTLGEVWPRLGTCRYALFAGLSEQEQALMEKRLTMYAYERADRDFSQGDRGTFETLGRRLKELPSLTSMNDRERAAALYRHYLNFTDQHGVTCSPLTTPCGHLRSAYNPVEVMARGKGGCNEFTRTLRQMFQGGGLPCDAVETWRPDGKEPAGKGSCHRALSMGRTQEGAPRDIYDPAMYSEETMRKGSGAPWDRALSWRRWVNQVHMV